MLIATPEPALRKKGQGPYRTSIFVGAKKEEGEKRQRRHSKDAHLSESEADAGEKSGKAEEETSAEMSGSPGNPLDPPVFTKMFTALYPLGDAPTTDQAVSGHFIKALFLVFGN